jgi:hypothetical protein
MNSAACFRESELYLYFERACLVIAIGSARRYDYRLNHARNSRKPRHMHLTGVPSSQVCSFPECVGLLDTDSQLLRVFPRFLIIEIHARLVRECGSCRDCLNVPYHHFSGRSHRRVVSNQQCVSSNWLDIDCKSCFRSRDFRALLPQLHATGINRIRLQMQAFEFRVSYHGTVASWKSRAAAILWYCHEYSLIS